MRTIIAMEKRLKRANEFRQRNFRRLNDPYVIAMEGPAVVVLQNKTGWQRVWDSIRRSIKDLWNPSAGGKDNMPNRTLKLKGIKIAMFVLALSVILLIIFSSALKFQ